MKFANCHPNKKHCAKGLCKACYNRALSNKPHIQRRGRQYAREYYWANRAEILAKSKLNRLKQYVFRKKAKDRNYEFIKEFLLTHPCVDCGEQDPIVLEFDHIRGKKYQDISWICSHGLALERVKREIGKCVVRCANCHRRRTVRGWRLKFKNRSTKK